MLAEKIPCKTWNKSPRARLERFAQSLLKFSFHKSQVHDTFFFRWSPMGKLIMLSAYVNDVIIKSDDSEEVEKMKARLTKGLKSRI